MCTDENMGYAYTHTRVAHILKKLIHRQVIEIDEGWVNLALCYIFVWTMVIRQYVCGGGMVVVRGRGGHVAQRVAVLRNHGRQKMKSDQTPPKKATWQFDTELLQVEPLFPFCRQL